MNYPLITEYLQAIASSEDNLDQLSHLRPVLDAHGEPYRSSGAFAVVFKMQDPESGKCYALKCFTEEQTGRADAYRLIAEELSAVDSPYITSVQYYDKELFVDSSCTDETEFPVLLMDWVEGVTMEQYIHENHQDTVKMQWLCYRFCRMASWLRSQALAHGDIKPDNVIVRPDGSLTLVDYDGMFVPSMKGQQSPTLGTRDFSHPERTVEDFDETIDDFALATTALSLKAIALDAAFYTHCGGTDRLLFSADDYRDLSQSQIWVKLQQLMYDKEFATLASQFLAALSQKTLQHLSFRLFNLSKPKEEAPDYEVIHEPTRNSDFHIQFKDDNCLYFKYDEDDKSKVWGVAPNLGKYGASDWQEYSQPTGIITIPRKIAKYQVIGIGEWAFHGCSSLQSIVIPDSVTEIGGEPFMGCSSLQSIIVEKNNPKYDSRNNCNAIIETSSNILVVGCQNTVIPDSVTGIGRRAFYGCSCLQSIVIPDSVTVIDQYAFLNCSRLQSIVIPDSVTEIGKGAFYGCSRLLSIVIPDSVTEIGNGAFYGCSRLLSIIVDKNNPKYDSRNNCDAIIETSGNVLVAGCKNTFIPYTVTEIGDDAFQGCSRLQSIEIPNSVTKIGDGAFRGCSSLLLIDLPNSVTEIGDGAFEDCSSLRSFFIQYAVEEIGGSAFSGCRSLQSIVIPDCVTEIEEFAFMDCRSLQSIDIPDSVEEIGGSAFSGCRSLQSIDIPDSVKKIRNCAFSNCSSLQSIVIPDSVTQIDAEAFNGCSNLQSIIVDRYNPKYDSRINCNAIIQTASSILVAGCKNTVIPDSVTEIGEYAFCGCSRLQSIVIPDSVTEMGESAFSGCSSLQSIVIPDSVTEIGNHAFFGCRSLQSIDIPDSVTEIGEYAFCGCRSLQSIDIPDSVTEIGESAFAGCSSLQSIDIPDSVTEIGDCAFEECSSLLSIVIPDSVAEIGTYAFSRCSSLQSIVIPDSATEIGKSVFRGCSSLQSIIVDNKNPKYNSRNNCNAIIEISSNILIAGCKNTIIPDSVTVIDQYAFLNCSSLQSIVIPESVTQIGIGAFIGCSSLQSIVIPDSVTQIGIGAFKGCSSLQSIVIPDSVTQIGILAFFGCSSLQSIKIKNPKLLEGTGVDLNKVKIITD